mgnify:CR=1 FL=1
MVMPVTICVFLESSTQGIQTHVFVQLNIDLVMPVTIMYVSLEKRYLRKQKDSQRPISQTQK